MSVQVEDCFVYVLLSEGRGGPRTYVGWTIDLDQRLAAHNDGRGARSTRGRHWLLVYAERHPGRRAAMAREWALKRDRAFRNSLREMWMTGADREILAARRSALPVIEISASDR